MNNLNFIKDIFTEDTGGHTMVDFIQLKNGKVLCVSNECVVLYSNLDAFYDSEGAEPTIAFSQGGLA